MRTTDDLLTGDRTLPGVVGPALPQPTPTSQELTERAGYLRASTRALSADVANVHDDALDRQLEARTDEASKRSVPELLSELADVGFAWRDIAHLVGVSVPALRKWRQGGPATGTNRRHVARLVAFVGVLTSDHLIQNVASWMEVPIGGSAVSGLDLYSAGKASDLLLHAAEHLPGSELLDRFDSQWRDHVDTRFEVATGGDGQPLVRLRSAE